MNYFDDNKINFDVLKKKAFNYRWAEVPDGIIPLTAADPDYPCSDAIKNAMMEYIKDGYFSYTPKLGLEEFKTSFVSYVKRRKNEDIDPECVLPVDSAARAMYIIAKTFLKPGDEMIVFDPCDYLFREACLSAGGVPVSAPVSLDPVNKKMDLKAIESVITPKTRMLGLCNPHNPYGLSYTKEELDQKEREFIQKYLDAGYELYNVERGGTLGKTMINERKASRSYRDGVEQGRKNIINEILPIVEKYLHITTQKDNKLSIRMLEKFYNILGVKECQKAELSGLEKTQTKK